MSNSDQSLRDRVNRYAFAPGTFAPAPNPAPIRKMLRSQAVIEAKLFLRHGEQQLLSFIIPLGMLFAVALLPIIKKDDPLQTGFPILLAVAAMSSGFTGQAISLAFDRRYGALQRTGASGVPAWTIVCGRILGVLIVSAVQLTLLSITALLLGWHASFGGFLMGVCVFGFGVLAFGALGLLMGGTLASEIVLGLANLIWFSLVGIAAYLITQSSESIGTLWQLIPSVALSQGLIESFEGTFPWAQLLILGGWALVAGLAANKWFKFHS